MTVIGDEFIVDAITILLMLVNAFTFVQKIFQVVVLLEEVAAMAVRNSSCQTSVRWIRSGF